MADRFDVIVIGMGPGGEVAASKLLDAGRNVAVLEGELIGGSCSYWACIPTKTLLRPPEVRSQAQRAFGLSTPDLDWQAVSEYRDYMVRNMDDSAQVKGYADQGATVFKSRGRLAGPGRVETDGRTLEADHIIIATGTEPAVPPIEGLDGVPYWTNRDAATVKDVPESVLIVGGGPVGIEFAQMFARFGSSVTLVEHNPVLLKREDSRVGELLAGLLEDDGVTVRTGVRVSRVAANGDDTEVTLDDGTKTKVARLIIASGRRPRTSNLGLDTVGVQPEKGLLTVDDRCRLGDGLWAIGDVTGVMPFTHTAKYQAKVAADNILGKDRTASYEGIPRVVFCEPEVAAVGLTEQAARDRGIDVVASTVELPRTLARPWTYEKEPRGEMKLIADRERRVLIGAWAVAPMAGEWIHYAALAVRAQVPLDTLTDFVAQFPTFAEGFVYAAEGLDIA